MAEFLAGKGSVGCKAAAGPAARARVQRAGMRAGPAGAATTEAEEAPRAAKEAVRAAREVREAAEQRAGRVAAGRPLRSSQHTDHRRRSSDRRKWQSC